MTNQPVDRRALLTAGTEGQELVNHTHSQPAFETFGPAAVSSEITRCRDALVRHTGLPSPWFRPSGTDIPALIILEDAGKVDAFEPIVTATRVKRLRPVLVSDPLR